MGACMASKVLLMLFSASLAFAADAGAPVPGRTPPMGWNSWNAFRCDIDAVKIRAAADALIASGLRDAGYVYVNIDDCWQAPQRDHDGRLQADPRRFPGGIVALAEYVHARGLKLGLYATPGSRTCANIWDGYPGKLGSLGHERQDARDFAEWGVDYLKYDWCRADEDGLAAEAAFTRMRDALREAGRPMFYSIHREPQLPVDGWRPQVANAWRTTPDIRPYWGKIMRNLDMQVGLEKFSSPGHWNDPDMLEVGNGALSVEENRAHFSLWALLNSPLLLGNDLARMDGETLAIVSNREVIEVNQDWAGVQGHKLRAQGKLEVWGKPMSDGGFAVVLLNRGRRPARIEVGAREMGFAADSGLRAKNLWTRAIVTGRGSLGETVPGHGVAMLRVWRQDD